MIRTVQLKEYAAAVEVRRQSEWRRERRWRRNEEAFAFFAVVMALIPPAKLIYEIAKGVVAALAR